MNMIHKYFGYATVCFISIGLISYSAVSKEAIINGKTWHVVQGVATSTPILIEKSPHPSFGEKRGRKNKTSSDKEETIELKAPPSVATSTPFDLRSDGFNAIDGLHFDFSVIENTCTASEHNQAAKFLVCNEELHTIEILDLVSNSFANLLSPSLPITVQPNACIEIRLVGNEKRQFDCSGIYSVSFEAQIEKSKYQGYFGATIIK